MWMRHDMYYYAQITPVVPYRILYSLEPTNQTYQEHRYERPKSL